MTIIGTKRSALLTFPFKWTSVGLETVLLFQLFTRHFQSEHLECFPRGAYLGRKPRNLRNRARLHKSHRNSKKCSRHKRGGKTKLAKWKEKN